MIILAYFAFSNTKNIGFRHTSHKILVILLTIGLIAQPLTNTLHLFSSNYGEFHQNFYGTVPIITQNEKLAYAWIRENTPPESILLVDPENWEITAVTGRGIIYSAYRFSTTDLRYLDIVTIYNTANVTTANLLLDLYGVDYIILTPMEQENYNGTGKFLFHPEFYTLVYSYEDVHILKYVNFP